LGVSGTIVSSNFVTTNAICTENPHARVPGLYYCEPIVFVDALPTGAISSRSPP